MADYRFDCKKCTNKAHGGPFDYDYCLPFVRNERAPFVFHDMGRTSLDYFTCDYYTTEPRTVAIYEMEVGNG